MEDVGGLCADTVMPHVGDWSPHRVWDSEAGDFLGSIPCSHLGITMPAGDHTFNDLLVIAVQVIIGNCPNISEAAVAQRSSLSIAEKLK